MTFSPRTYRRVRKKPTPVRPNSYRRGYTKAWAKARRAYLAEHPFCECEDCKAGYLLKPATVVDHKIPHGGNEDLFWDRSNWQALAFACHSRKTVLQDGGLGRSAR